MPIFKLTDELFAGASKSKSIIQLPMLLFIVPLVLFVFGVGNSLAVEPSRPSLTKEGIADDHFNVTFVPGTYDSNTEGPIGNSFYIKYKESDSDAWKV